MTDAERLGVAPGAPREVLEKAFLRLKLAIHPDIINGRRRKEAELAGRPPPPPDPRADEDWKEAEAAFRRLAAETNNGTVPQWATELIERWDLVVAAIAAGDIPATFGQLQILALFVEERARGTIATAVEIRDTVKQGYDGLKSIGKGCHALWKRFTGAK